MRIFKKSMAIFLGTLIIASTSVLPRLSLSAEGTSKNNLIENYEGKEIDTAVGGGRVVDSGNSVHGKVISHTRNTDAVWEGDVSVGLDAARNAEYDGISFYVNNVTRKNSEKIPEILCFIKTEKDRVAQKFFKVQEVGKFIKFTIWFENVGNYDTGNEWWNPNNSGVDITGQRATLQSLEIRFRNTEVGDVFYFDDFCYEKKPVQSDGSYVNTASNNGYQTGTRAFGAIFTEIANAKNVKTGFVIWTEKLFKESQKTELDLNCVDSNDNASALDISYSSGQPEKLYGILRNNKGKQSVTDAYAKTVFVARPYITYTDAGGNVQTVYGDMITSQATK